MRRVEFIVQALIDDADAKEHVKRHPNQYPLVADDSEWTWDDLCGAEGYEIATDLEITGYTILAELA